MCPPTPDPSADIPLNANDEQVIMYLNRLMRGSPLPRNVIEDVNPYQDKPSNLRDADGFWYLVHSDDKKENEFGIWKVKEQASEVFTDTFISGWRTTLESFEFQDSPKHQTRWLMQEYKITNKGLCSNNEEKEPRSICRVLSFNTEMQPTHQSAVIVEANDARIVPSTALRIEHASNQGSSSRSLMKYGADGTQPSSDAGKLLDLRKRDSSELDPIFGGDYLELDDLVDPESHSSSSVASSCTSMTFDEYFDPNALLQELEDNNSREQANEYFDPNALLQELEDNNSREQANDSSSSASMRPFEVVMQQPTSGSVVCAGGGPPQQTGCTQANSAIKTVFLDERIPYHSVKRLEAEQRDKDPSCSNSAAAPPNAKIPSPKEEKKAAGVKTKGLKKYSRFLPF